MLILLAALYLLIRENGKKLKEKLLALLKQGWITGFLFYLALILTSTVFVRGVQTPYRNLVGCFGLCDDPDWNFEVLRNIALFIPYTFLYIKAFTPKRTFISSLLISIGTTLFIELSQLIFWLGECQLSDIVHNTLGGILGYAIWYLIDKKTIRHLWVWIRKISNLNKQ